MAKTTRRAQIPAAVRRWESLRRTVTTLLADLLGKQRGRAYRSASRQSGAKVSAVNAWRKCPTCFHRHPALCLDCGNGALTSLAPAHPTACCPGQCRRCGRCRTICRALCEQCGECADRCPGHEEARS